MYLLPLLCGRNDDNCAQVPSFLFHVHRRRVPAALESGTTKPTLYAEGVVDAVCTSRSRNAQAVPTQQSVLEAVSIILVLRKWGIFSICMIRG